MSSSLQTTTLDALPNELLQQILLYLPTSALLPLTTTSQRIYCLILHILTQRLSLAASLAYNHVLLLQCCHPAVTTEPPSFCTYLGTDGLEQLTLDTAKNELPAGSALRTMKGMYSRYRLRKRRVEPLSPRPGDIPGSRTHPGRASISMNTTVAADEPFPPQFTPPNTSSLPPVPRESPPPDTDLLDTQTIHLDSGERFTQLCATTSIVKAGPHKGLFESVACIDEGVVRVFRNWLAQRDAADKEDDDDDDTRAADERIDSACASSTSPSPSPLQSLHSSQQSRQQQQQQQKKNRKSALNNDYGYRTSSTSILWTSPAQAVGMKTRVHSYNDIIDDEDDDSLPVAYEVEFEEMLVRTTRLLQVTEQSLEEIQNSRGRKAVLFGRR